MYIIYKITCTVNQKIYIGVTSQPIQKRWYQHRYLAKSGKGSHLHRAIKLYGESNFTIEIIFNGTLRRNDVERWFIGYYDSFVNGFNATQGGEDFTSSEYQRELQLSRVSQGTHPFIGGKIQKASSLQRWENGTNPLKGLNQLRVSNGTHNLLKGNNPQTKRALLGIHHNQTKAWYNTNISEESKKAWLIADQLYNWYIQHNHLKRGGSYKNMAKAFNLNCSLQVIYYKYFKQGWIPNQDQDWVEWQNSY